MANVITFPLTLFLQKSKILLWLNLLPSIFPFLLAINTSGVLQAEDILLLDNDDLKTFFSSSNMHISSFLGSSSTKIDNFDDEVRENALSFIKHSFINYINKMPDSCLSYSSLNLTTLVKKMGITAPKDRQGREISRLHNILLEENLLQESIPYTRSIPILNNQISIRFVLDELGKSLQSFLDKKTFCNQPLHHDDNFVFPFHMFIKKKKKCLIFQCFPNLNINLFIERSFEQFQQVEDHFENKLNNINKKIRTYFVGASIASGIFLLILEGIRIASSMGL